MVSGLGHAPRGESWGKARALEASGKVLGRHAGPPPFTQPLSRHTPPLGMQPLYIHVPVITATARLARTNRKSSNPRSVMPGNTGYPLGGYGPPPPGPFPLVL